jgi:hypothetical protein
MASLRTRAVSLLRSSLRLSSEAEGNEQIAEKGPAATSSLNTEPLMNEKLPLDERGSPGDKPLSFSSAEKTANPLGDSAVIEDLESQRLVRVIPSQ